MGCDIHFYVEKKDQTGQWKSVDVWEREGSGKNLWVNVPYESRIYNNRNYNLFAILADVRNGCGFAGVDTGDGFKPIADPRGVPEDASAEYLQQVDQWEGDGHSHSYFTLAELIAFDWENQHTNLRGIVDWESFVKWKSEGMEQYKGSYCGGISGRNIEVIPMEDAKRWVDFELTPEKQMPGKDVHVKIQWKMSYADCCRDFLERTIPALETFADGDNESVRIVFFFDN